MSKFAIYPVDGEPGFYLVTGGMVGGEFKPAIKIAGKEHAEEIRDARERVAYKRATRNVQSAQVQYPRRKDLLIPQKPPRVPKEGTIWNRDGEIYILHSDNNTMQVAKSNEAWIRYQQGRKTYIHPVKGRYQLWISKKKYHSVKREAERESKKLKKEIEEKWSKH